METKPYALMTWEEIAGLLDEIMDTQQENEFILVSEELYSTLLFDTQCDGRHITGSNGLGSWATSLYWKSRRIEIDKVLDD